MYSASIDLHATCPLYQCLSLVDLDRYLLCGVVFSVVTCGLFGLGESKILTSVHSRHACLKGSGYERGALENDA